MKIKNSREKWGRILEIYENIFPYLKKIRGATRLKNFLLKEKMKERRILIEGNGCPSVLLNNLKLNLPRNFKVWLLQNFFEHIKEYTREYKPKAGDNVIDAGAYPGYFTIYLSKKIENGKIIAFEPNKENFKELEKNINLNNCSNILKLQKALWDNKCNIGLEGCGETVKISKNSKNKVEATTIDSEVEKLDLKGVDFIKMDIEGAEVRALEGAKKTLRKYGPPVAIASYHKINGEKSYKKVEKMLNEMDYSVYTKNQKITYGTKG